MEGNSSEDERKPHGDPNPDSGDNQTGGASHGASKAPGTTTPATTGNTISKPTADQLRAAREALAKSRADNQTIAALEEAQKSKRKSSTPAPAVEREVVIKQSEKPKKSALTGILDAATEKLAEPRTKRAKEKTAEENDPQQELSTLISSLIVIGVTAANMPKEIKPEDDEIDGFSYHFTNIIFRHIPIKHGLPADFLDIIGMLAILASWYSRAAPYLSGDDNSGNNGRKPPPKPRQPVIPPDDISMVDPQTAAFLRHGGNGQNSFR